MVSEAHKYVIQMNNTLNELIDEDEVRSFENTIIPLAIFEALAAE